jgi:transposase
MAQRSGLTRGDRRRNNRIETLRAVVRPDRAILSIDLGEDKQVAALMDHDGRVLGRRVVTAKAHALGGLLEWSAVQAVKHGQARFRRAAGGVRTDRAPVAIGDAVG